METKPTVAETIAANIGRQTLSGTAYIMSEEHLKLALNTDTQAAIDGIKSLLPSPENWDCSSTAGKVSFRRN